MAKAVVSIVATTVVDLEEYGPPFDELKADVEEDVNGWFRESESIDVNVDLVFSS